MNTGNHFEQCVSNHCVIRELKPRCERFLSKLQAVRSSSEKWRELVSKAVSKQIRGTKRDVSIYEKLEGR
jgi:hypothetical protein